jgi:hypothetical protein
VHVFERAAFRGQESAEHLREELHALARADPGIQRGGVDLLPVLQVHVAAIAAALDVDAPVVAVEDLRDLIGVFRLLLLPWLAALLPLTQRLVAPRGIAPA